MINTKNLSARVWQDPIYFIAFGFGSGLAPVTPGTWGTLAAVPLYLIFASLPLINYVILTVGLFALGVWVSHKVTNDLGVHDYKGIVWDEVVGYLLTMVGIPFNWLWMIIGFLLFRVFDIWKPMPISIVDKRLKGGFGVMLDDALAAMCACLILHGIVWALK